MGNDKLEKLITSRIESSIDVKNKLLAQSDFFEKIEKITDWRLETISSGAMALKNPIIGNKTVGIMNMLDNGDVGPLVEPDDAEAFYEAAKLPLTNREESKKVSQNVFRQLQENYTIETHVSNMGKLYDEIFLS